MGRLSLLIVGAVAASSVPARAEIDDEPCACEPYNTMLPASGAVGVPRNAKLWIFNSWVTQGTLTDTDLGELGAALPRIAGESVSTTGRPVEQFVLGPLAAHRAYTFTAADGGPRVAFSTSGSDDTTPPPAPEIRTITLAVADDAQLGAPVTRPRARRGARSRRRAVAVRLPARRRHVVGDHHAGRLALARPPGMPLGDAPRERG